MNDFRQAAPVIINACLTGMVAGKRDNPALPVTPEEVVRDALAVAERGASIVHVHARDADGRPTWDPGVYREIIAGIREHAPALVICASTSGRLWNERAKRTAVLGLDEPFKPDMASLTLGTILFLSHTSSNTPADIRYLLDAMIERGIKPEFEVFDLEMARRAREWVPHGGGDACPYFNILLGNRTTAPADDASLSAILSALPGGNLWAGAGIGRHQFPVNCLALRKGGGVRTGLEDSLNVYDEKGKRLTTNAELVGRVVEFAESLGRRPSSAAETRRMLGLSAGPQSASRTGQQSAGA